MVSAEETTGELKAAAGRRAASIVPVLMSDASCAAGGKLDGVFCTFAQSTALALSATCAASTLPSLSVS